MRAAGYGQKLIDELETFGRIAEYLGEIAFLPSDSCLSSFKPRTGDKDGLTGYKAKGVISSGDHPGELPFWARVNHSPDTWQPLLLNSNPGTISFITIHGISSTLTVLHLFFRY